MPPAFLTLDLRGGESESLLTNTNEKNNNVNSLSTQVIILLNRAPTHYLYAITPFTIR